MFVCWIDFMLFLKIYFNYKQRVIKALDLQTRFRFWKAKKVVKALDLEMISSDIWVEKITYIISRGIHNGTKITSKSLKKLTDYWIGYKACKRNAVGTDPRYDSTAPQLFLFFFFFSFTFMHFSSLSLVLRTLKPFPCMAIYRKRPFGAGEAHPSELVA